MCLRGVGRVRVPEGQRAILAYFPSPGKAEAARRRLEEEGFTAVSVDRVGRYPAEGTEVLHNPATGDFDSLSDLVLGTESGPDTAILRAADPSVSGGARTPLAGGHAYLVSVVCDTRRSSRAEAILRAAGGLL